MIHADEDGAILCPQCGGDCMHVVGVGVGFRAEDSTGTVVDVDAHDTSNDPPSLIERQTECGYDMSRIDVTVQTGIAGNRHDGKFGVFSKRRSRVTLTFACEGCDELSTMHVDQHKGQTFVTWDGHDDD